MMSVSLSFIAHAEMEDLFGVATFVQGTIVQGDICPRDFCPMTQLSKQTFVQGDFCPRSEFDEVRAAHIIFSSIYTTLVW